LFAIPNRQPLHSPSYRITLPDGLCSLVIVNIIVIVIVIVIVIIIIVNIIICQLSRGLARVSS
jgi:hypothetical protein